MTHETASTARERLRQRFLLMAEQGSIRPQDIDFSAPLAIIQRLREEEAASMSDTDNEASNRLAEHQWRALEADPTIATGWPPLQPVVDWSLERLEAALHQRGTPLSDGFYAGVYPIGQFNAMSLATPDGTLVLINLGTMMLLNKLGKLFMYFVHLRPVWDPPLIELLRRIFTAFLHGDVRTAPIVPALGGRLATMTSSLVASAEGFILAHEIAHFMLGHLDGLKPVQSSTPQPSMIAFKHQREFDADAFAVNCMLAGGIRENAVPKPYSDATVWSDLFTGGPRFFFRVAQALTKIAVTWKLMDIPQGASTHPTPAARLGRVEGLLATAHMPAPGSLLTVFDLWVADATMRMIDQGPLATPAADDFCWPPRGDS